ncbi:hypothetical protein GCM10017667_56400 [Streptomyces filamentosus]|uniref:Uncharacterized protein n=1 Tax=Streptomyces filamentosus TaxID=67294 RepID=A0A919ER49_STRFL|nr:hypothetical protein GCM10017667_56400 [Streptomyces filamentosus]
MAHGLPLRVLDDVRVDVHRHGDLAVSEDLHHDAGRDAGGGEERRRTVPGVVQPDDAETGVLGDAGERAVEVARLDGLAGAGGEDVPGLRPLLPGTLAGGGLLEALPPQGSDADRGKGKRLFAPAPLGVVSAYVFWGSDPYPAAEKVVGRTMAYKASAVRVSLLHQGTRRARRGARGPSPGPALLSPPRSSPTADRTPDSSG